MAVTFSLPTVLARLADGQATIEADRRRRSATSSPQIAGPLSAARAAAPRRDGRTLSVRDLLSERRGHPVSNGFATPVRAGDEITVVAAIAGG